ncbi:type II toxin-antitoxin system VapC family toxin [Mesorhizobium sp. M0130]|uniref:type II toxin-antitoxin system VapC family toxin n=1 Tax=Mesorhizobium sp. M0130 TaxID=2956887 RepID=UPI003334BC3D
MTTFVDTNVLLDAMDVGAPRHKWAKEQLARADQPVVLCDIGYSEFSVSIATLEEANKSIRELALDRAPFSDESLFRAGKAYAEYKKRGGTKNNVLSDFLIGALAEAEQAPLLTANERDFRSYFPSITLICPSK